MVQVLERGECFYCGSDGLVLMYSAGPDKRRGFCSYECLIWSEGIPDGGGGAVPEGGRD